MPAEKIGGHRRRGGPPSRLQILGNRIGEYGLQSFVKDDAAAVRHVRAAALAMPGDVFQKRQAETDNAFDAGLSATLMMMKSQPEHFDDSALEHVVLVPEVRVERRSGDISAVQDVLDRDGIIRCLTCEADQCIVRSAPCLPNTLIG